MVWNYPLNSIYFVFVTFGCQLIFANVNRKSVTVYIPFFPLSGRMLFAETMAGDLIDFDQFTFSLNTGKGNKRWVWERRRTEILARDSIRGESG